MWGSCKCQSKGSVVLFVKAFYRVFFFHFHWNVQYALVECSHLYCEWMVFCVVRLNIRNVAVCVYTAEFDWRFFWYALTGGWIKCRECCTIWAFFFSLLLFSCFFYSLLFWCSHPVSNYCSTDTVKIFTHTIDWNHWKWTSKIWFESNANGSHLPESDDFIFNRLRNAEKERDREKEPKYDTMFSQMEVSISFEIVHLQCVRFRHDIFDVGPYKGTSNRLKIFL